MQKLLVIRKNDGKLQSELSINCCLFSPYGSPENSVESIGIQGKSILDVFTRAVKILAWLRNYCNFYLILIKLKLNKNVGCTQMIYLDLLEFLDRQTPRKLSV
ncbi:hypothetical protein E5S67_03852 [Microcoleus sp. IPMA8]|uniref:Uncharacterized protein n=1 Tax=Microcoleus asticus IPMA8 TaxID=2563858 RepID=A0ABX2D0A4_9CYAN|nr:hypothetical protein [Microcoleus asticus IPMA8]